MTKKKPRSVSEQERDSIMVSRLYLEGKLQAEIAYECKISQPTVSRIIKELITEWQVERVYNINESKARELAKIDRLELEYWNAWRRSQEDAVVNTKGTTSTGSIDTTRTEGQAGDPRFLDGIMKCIDRRCAILGVDAPKKIEGEGTPIYVLPIGIDVDKI